MAGAFTVCVVGTGSIGLRHLRLLAAQPGVRAVAAPRRANRVAELAAEGFEVLSPGEQLGLGRFDAAIIASDTGQHVADAGRLGHACPLLIEKPLAPDAQAARPLAGRAGSTHVACVLRFDPGLQWVRERLPQLGPLLLADAECLSWLPAWRPTRDYRQSYSARPGEGGVLRDLVHELDYLGWLLGPTAAVSASAWSSGVLGLPSAVEESALATLRTAAGVRVSLRLSFAVHASTRRLRLWGERGSLTWDATGRSASHHAADGTELGHLRWEEPARMYAAQLEAWLALVREGRPSHLATLDEGLAALEVLDAMRRSSESGREVAVA